MALSDPQTITVATLASTLPRTEQDKTANGYTNADGTMKFTVSHQYGRRNRTIIRIDFNKIGTDPYTAAKSKLTMSTYLLVDRPAVGFTVTELKDIVSGLTGWIGAATNANLIKVLGGEA